MFEQAFRNIDDILRKEAGCTTELDYTREARADNARVYINSHFNTKQQAFLDFVLSHYVTVGVEELDQQKLTPLLRLKYGAIQDAVADLGRPEKIGKVFTGFQKYLYPSRVA